jgi:hypothetical protein
MKNTNISYKNSDDYYVDLIEHINRKRYLVSENTEVVYGEAVIQYNKLALNKIIELNIHIKSIGVKTAINDLIKSIRCIINRRISLLELQKM